MSDMQREVFLCLLFSLFFSFFSFSSFSTHFISIYFFPYVYIIPVLICMQCATNWSNTGADTQTHTIMHISQPKTAATVPTPIILSLHEALWLMLNIFMQSILILHTHTLSVLWLAVHERRKEGREHRVRLRAGPLIGYMNQTHALRFFDLSWICGRVAGDLCGFSKALDSQPHQVRPLIS